MKRFIIVVSSALILFPLLICSAAVEPTHSSGRNLLELNKFDLAINDFSQAIEKNKSKEAVANFLRLIKLKPNREIIQRLAEVSGLKKLYPLAYNKPYEWSPVFSPDGTKIVYQSWQKAEGGPVSINNSIFVMDIDGSNTKEIVNSQFDNASPMFSPDGQHILFLSWHKDTNNDGKISAKDNRGIYVVDTNGQNLRCLVDETYQNNEPIWSPDSQSVLFQSWRDDTNNDGKITTADRRSLFIIGRDGRNERKVADSRFINTHPVFSPDSRFIIVHRIIKDTNNDGVTDQKDNRAIFMIELATGTEKQLTDDRFDSEFSAFSPDNRLIAFFSRRGPRNNRGIYLRDLETGRETEVVKPNYDSEFLSFSFDGHEIAYTSYRRDTNNDGLINSDDNRGIYVVGLNPGDEEIAVVGDQYDNEFLSFYPDNKKIIFQSWRQDTNGDGTINMVDNSSIFIVDILSQPTMKVTTILKPNGSGTRVVELTSDPMFRADRDLQQAVGKDWKIEYVEAGNYHFKAMSEFRHIESLGKETYPISFIATHGLFHINSVFKEVFTSETKQNPTENPFLKLGHEIAQSSAKPMSIQAKVTFPGGIIRTNAMTVNGRTATWQFSINDILKSGRNYEIVAEVQYTNWPMTVFFCLVLLSVSIFFVRRSLMNKKRVEQLNRQMAKEYAESHNYLGAAFYHKGLYEEAIVEYSKSIDFEPGYGMAHYNMAKALAKLGKNKESEKSLKTALRLDPGLSESAKADFTDSSRR